MSYRVNAIVLIFTVHVKELHYSYIVTLHYKWEKDKLGVSGTEVFIVNSVKENRLL
jgi:hypothetical protein